jgi:hypothetical protein
VNAQCEWSWITQAARKQEVTKSADWIMGNVLFSVFASTDHPGRWLVSIFNGTTVAVTAVAVGGYQNYTVGVFVPQSAM